MSLLIGTNENYDNQGRLVDGTPAVWYVLTNGGMMPGGGIQSDSASEGAEGES